jgi:hypothetical protein
VILPGTAVVQGSKERTVKAQGTGGTVDYIGIYAFEANEAKAAGDEVGITLTGVVKVVAGGNVTAGKKAVVKSDTSGSLIDLPSTDGQYTTCGTFLESGVAGEYVDMIVERGNVTIPAAP